ncbi:hypothetical protein PG997_011746 [Apiospora hydei]|uniref:F-box domain-containing protein n=1 Tax=Apiospora hydei TaxID=1337664 RepID=A0ABR1V4K3_9PEZI
MDSLPVELWCSIFRLLDPVGLIAASQACPEFRRIIKPGRVHCVERLLALECQAEHGGPVPIFRPRDYELEPAWEDAAWTRMRWACAGCMRLLPDAAFDNHSLLRLGYRKPAPGTPGSRAVTSWDPSANGLPHRQWRGENRDKTRAREKQVRKQYGIAHTWNWGIPKDSQDPLQRLMSFQDAGLAEFRHCGLEYFQCMDIEEERDMFDRAATAIEAERMGHRRHLRRCNECRWRRGEMKVHRLPTGDVGWRHSGPNVGTADVPIVRSRQVLLPSALDRWFPGWSSVFLNGPWTLYMVRCPDCARWQELRAFRCGDVFHKWQPTATREAAFENWDGERITDKYIDGLTCNACFRAKHGDERLARELGRWWGVLADSELRSLEFDMSYGWRLLMKRAETWLLDDEGEGEGGDEPKIPMNQLTGNVEFEQLTDAERTALRQRQRRLAEYAASAPPSGTPSSYLRTLTTGHRDQVGTRWMEYWTSEYGAMDDWWSWLRRCKEAFEAEPKLLLVDPDFVAGVIRRGAELEREVSWAPLSEWKYVWERMRHQI